MIIWSGHGYLVAIYAFGASLLMELVTKAIAKDGAYYQRAAWPLALALIVAGGLSFVTATALHKNRDDSEGHSLFFLPMKWWGPILAVIGVIVFIVRTLSSGS